MGTPSCHFGSQVSRILTSKFSFPKLHYWCHDNPFSPTQGPRTHIYTVHVLYCFSIPTPSSDVPMADVRSSLLDGKQQTVNNGSANGNVGLEDDLLAKRNSYASFRGGYDSGMPGDDPPDLIE